MQNETPLSEKVVKQMPESVEPGSLLAMVQNPLISLLWELADTTKLNRIKSIENWFSNEDYIL